MSVVPLSTELFPPWLSASSLRYFPNANQYTKIEVLPEYVPFTLNCVLSIGDVTNKVAVFAGAIQTIG